MGCCDPSQAIGAAQRDMEGHNTVSAHHRTHASGAALAETAHYLRDVGLSAISDRCALIPSLPLPFQGSTGHLFERPILRCAWPHAYGTVLTTILSVN
jgi:hypothetical protein